MEKTWCEHIKFYEDCSGEGERYSPINKNAYRNKYLIQSPISEAKLIIPNWWICCPICGTKRPEQTKCKCCGRSF